MISIFLSQSTDSTLKKYSIFLSQSATTHGTMCHGSLHNPCQISAKLRLRNLFKIKKMTGEIPEARSDKRKPSWTFLEHQSALVSIYQNINQHIN